MQGNALLAVLATTLCILLFHFSLSFAWATSGVALAGKP